MKLQLLLGLLLAMFMTLAPARGVRPWSDAELRQAAELVVVGQPIQVRDLDETNSLGWSGTESFRPRFRGVETTFRVSEVLKGRPENDLVVLHHYREEIEWGSPPNGPGLIGFPVDGTNQYLLYLIHDGTNRYAPVTGQIDPGLSIKAAPRAGADPAIRQRVSVRVPTRLKIERTTDMLSVGVDNQSSLEATNLRLDTNLVTGVKSELYVYPAGTARPAPANDRGCGGLASGLDFNLGIHLLHMKPDGIPLPGIKYIVEMDLTMFETDIPGGHMWHPQSSKNYKELWRRTLKQVSE
jgi:hypothetical protein